MKLLPLLALLAAAGTLYAGTHYVDVQNGAGAASPYTNWATAATIIQDAVNVAEAGALILVNTGVYASGGALTPGFALSNRVVATQAVTIASVGGPAVTVIAGARDYASDLGLGSNAVRGVLLRGGAQLHGFTVSNGATFGFATTSGHSVYERSGGGVFMEDAVLSNCIVTANAAGNYGGAVFGFTGAVVYASHLSSNWAFGYGGGIAWTTNSSVRDSVISGNVVSNWDGGGLHASASGLISNCLISGNLCQKGSGGGVLVFRADLEMVDCVIRGNRCAAGRGGGAFFNSLTSFRTLANNCRFEDNSIHGSQYGGGAYVTMATLNNCLIARNYAAVYGGGLAVYSSKINNCTIVSNRTDQRGGGIYLMGIQTVMRNSIVYHNSVPGADTNFYFGTGAASITCTYSCTFPTFVADVNSTNYTQFGEGNITNDPQLVDLVSGNYRLLPGSPCINAGSNAYVVGELDLDGTARIKQTIVDMGAYEAVPEPALLVMALLAAVSRLRLTHGRRGT